MCQHVGGFMIPKTRSEKKMEQRLRKKFPESIPTEVAVQIVLLERQIGVWLYRAETATTVDEKLVVLAEMRGYHGLDASPFISLSIAGLDPNEK